MSKYGVFSGPYFPVFELNTEIYNVNLRIQFEYGEIRPEKTPYVETFHAVQGSVLRAMSFIVVLEALSSELRSGSRNELLMLII